MVITEREQREIDKANESGLKPVVFVHGLWLLPSSWDLWREFFESKGYATLAPGWPDDPETVEEAHAHSEVFAHKSLRMITDHYCEVIEKLSTRPAVVGHSFGGDIAQMIAGRGLSDATVAIDPAPFRGVLPLPLASLISASPAMANPANYWRAVTLTYDQFKYGWGNALSDEETRALYEKYHVAGSGVPIFQAASANLLPWTEDAVDTKNPERGPMLLISGSEDHTVPPVVVKAEFDKQKRNSGLTEFLSIENRGHSLTIDSGWREVAEAAIAFVGKHAPASGMVAG